MPFLKKNAFPFLKMLLKAQYKSLDVKALHNCILWLSCLPSAGVKRKYSTVNLIEQILEVPISH